MLEEEEYGELEPRIALASSVSLTQPVVNSLRKLECPPCYARVDCLWMVMAAVVVVVMVMAAAAQVAQVVQVW